MTESRASRTSEMSRGGVRPTNPNSGCMVDSKKLIELKKVGQVGEVYEALSQPGM